MSCDVGEAIVGEALPHSSTLTSLHLCHSSFSNPSAILPMSQLILQPFRCFTYVIGTSLTSPGGPPMPLWWCLIYPWWLCNLQWLRPAGLYERCKLALELKMECLIWDHARQNHRYHFFCWEDCHCKHVGYLDMLHLYSVPQLPDGTIYQEVGAPPHFANIIRTFLEGTIPCKMDRKRITVLHMAC